MFRSAIGAVARSADPPDELIVVLDGPERPLPEWLPAGVRVLYTGRRSGPAGARNLGARAAGSDVIFFVDADVTIGPDVVGRVRRTFAERSELTALIGSYDDSPGDSGFVSQYRNLLHHYMHQTARPEASTFWGACGAIRRSAFLAAGGFDEGYDRPSVEDIELGYRLKDAGHRILLDPELQVKHLKHWSVAGMLRTDVLDRAIPWTELLLRRRRAERDLNLTLRSRLSVLAVLVLVGGLATAIRFLPAAGAALVGAFVLLALNAPFYLFLARKRTPAFAIRAVPWHWLYFAYGGAAFAVGLVRHVSRRPEIA